MWSYSTLITVQIHSLQVWVSPTGSVHLVAKGLYSDVWVWACVCVCVRTCVCVWRGFHYVNLHYICKLVTPPRQSLCQTFIHPSNLHQLAYRVLETMKCFRPSVQSYLPACCYCYACCSLSLLFFVFTRWLPKQTCIYLARWGTESNSHWFSRSV